MKRVTAPPSAGQLIDALKRADQLCQAPTGLPGPTALAEDSRLVTPGSWFVARRGTGLDGHDFLPGAAERGAGAAIVGHPVAGLALPQIVVHNPEKALLALARAWYDDPAARLRLFAVTGTNGKTTTVSLLRHLLNGDGRAGSIGTLGAQDGEGAAVESTEGALTTPGVLPLHALLAEMVRRGVTSVAMEASSHGLHQRRLDGMLFEGVVFTNLTRDHFDYHGDFAEYRAAKLGLLDLLVPGGTVAVNIDDPAWCDLPSHGGRTIRYGLSGPADLTATATCLDGTGSRFRMEGAFGAADVVLPLLGEFNVSNALGAAAVLLGAGCSIQDVSHRLGSAPQVTGRMERIVDDPCVILRDYAHTPDALARVLDTLRPMVHGRLIVVFGCGGDRDPGKRPLMGSVVAHGADLAIVTSDNPRTEDPGRIMEDILAGMDRTETVAIVDRRAAIARAIEEAGAEDTIVLAGKGHETYQILGETRFPFDERLIVLDLLGRGAS